MIIVIVLCVLLSKEFTNNGKTGASRYIGGMMGSSIGFSFIEPIISYAIKYNASYSSYGLTNIFTGMAFPLLALAVPIYLFIQGRKEARAYDPNNPYQNPQNYEPFNGQYNDQYQNYGNQQGNPYQNYTGQQGVPYQPTQVNNPYASGMPPVEIGQQNAPYPAVPPFSQEPQNPNNSAAPFAGQEQPWVQYPEAQQTTVENWQENQ